MEKLNETLNRVDVTQTAPKESGHGDHRNEEGLLICGKCGTPKEMRLTCEALGRSSIVPIPSILFFVKTQLHFHQIIPQPRIESGFPREKHGGFNMHSLTKLIHCRHFFNRIPSLLYQL